MLVLPLCWWSMMLLKHLLYPLMFFLVFGSWFLCLSFLCLFLTLFLSLFLRQFILLLFLILPFLLFLFLPLFILFFMQNSMSFITCQHSRSSYSSRTPLFAGRGGTYCTRYFEMISQCGVTFTIDLTATGVTE